METGAPVTEKPESNSSEIRQLQKLPKAFLNYLKE